MSTALPPSVTDFRVALVGLACFLLGTAVVCVQGVDPHHAIPILMACTGVPILILDLAVLRVHRRPSTGIDWSHRRPIDPQSVATRWLGALGVLAPAAIVLALAPEYQGSFYDPFYEFLRWILPVALVLGAGWFAWIDGRLVEPRDGYWHLGALLSRQPTPVDYTKIGQVLRTLAVKAFFLPLMYVYAIQNFSQFQADYERDVKTLQTLFDGLFHLAYLIDVIFVTVGYLVTVRLFDSHVRSAEPTMTGWVVALCCYQPFFGLFSGQYLRYEDGFEWGEWLQNSPPLRVLWGAAILAAVGVYTSATVAFGARFSNLTYRGITTCGPYRWTKHPAYVSKCCSFWLIFIPFVSRGSLYEVARDCTWLAALCGVYWLRARTEEAHLSQDPDYVTYATAMNERSVFAPLGRWFPALAYRPPA